VRPSEKPDVSAWGQRRSETMLGDGRAEGRKGGWVTRRDTKGDAKGDAKGYRY
jgi:hypothetical protein